MPKAKKLKIYIYVISHAIIYNLSISLFYLFLLCSLILSFCNTIFNLFFTLSLCNICFYFVILYYHNVFDIFKMLRLFLLCVSFYDIHYYLLLVNEHISCNDYYCDVFLSVFVLRALIFKMIILQPLAPKAKKLLFLL